MNRTKGKEIDNMGKFKKYETSIDGVYVIEPTVFGDERGYFMETYEKNDFEEIGITGDFVQDNQQIDEMLPFQEHY